MNSNLDRFNATRNWYRIAVQALNMYEQEVRHPKGHLEELQMESKQSVLTQIGMSRDELENFALLSLWALFEEAVNDWLVQRVKWIGLAPEFDQGMCNGLSRRIHHWPVAEKIDVLKTLVGKETTKNLQAIRKWRDWVAHRKPGARPAAVDFEMAQSLFVVVLTHLEACPAGEAVAIS